MAHCILQAAFFVSIAIISVCGTSVLLLNATDVKELHIPCGETICKPGEKCEHFASCLATICPPPPPPRCVPIPEKCGDNVCQPGEKCEYYASCLSLNCPPPPPPRCVPIPGRCGDTVCGPDEECKTFVTCLAIGCPPAKPPRCEPIPQNCGQITCRPGEKCVLRRDLRTGKLVPYCRPVFINPCAKINCPKGTKCIATPRKFSDGFIGICQKGDPCSNILCPQNQICSVETVNGKQIGICIKDPCSRNPCRPELDCFPNKIKPTVPDCVTPITPCAYTTIICPPGKSCGRDPKNPRVATCL